MSEFKQFETFILSSDLNPVVTRGMTGYILEVWNDGEAYEVEFVKTDGSNYEYCGSVTFAITPDKMTRK